MPVVAAGSYADGERQALEQLGFVKLEGLAREYAGNLSGGQRKRRARAGARGIRS